MKCFEFYFDSPKNCKKCECRYWVAEESYKNCVLIGAKNGPRTLQVIGDIFNITRMRVCQIEKKCKPVKK